MKRIKSLNPYQKIILSFMFIMVAAFSIIYPMVISREGFLYMDSILVPDFKNDHIIYSGKIAGETACFIVYDENKVEFQYNNKIYGPYTAKKDPNAIPKHSDMATYMTGVTLLNGESILFRGGVIHNENGFLLYNEDGTLENINISLTAENGTILDENGNIVDPMEPAPSVILNVMAGPQLIHKGIWEAWFFGIFICIAAAISILFADELFHFRLFFQIKNAEDAQPSDWEVTSRYIVWTVMPIAAMITFIIGLR